MALAWYLYHLVRWYIWHVIEILNGWDMMKKKSKKAYPIENYLCLTDVINSIKHGKGQDFCNLHMWDISHFCTTRGRKLYL